jgi:ATP-dependent DNA helicase PIF1
MLGLVRRGANVFMTGDAGTGKTAMIGPLVEMANEDHRIVHLTASTGVAAMNAAGMRCAQNRAARAPACRLPRSPTPPPGWNPNSPVASKTLGSPLTAQTLHSFAGCGLDWAKLSGEALEKRVRANASALRRLLAVQLLIIDEVSMVSGELFDMLDELMRAIRDQVDKPFGGVQVVTIGDFLQLRAVPLASRTDGAPARTATLAFLSKAWKACDFEIVLLTEVVRQPDHAFATLLSSMRVGDYTAVARSDALRARVLSPEAEIVGGEIPHLYTHAAHVDEHNRSVLELLASPLITFSAEDYFR